MIRLLKTDATNPDFVALVKQLDAELAIRDGDDHSFYNQFNKIDAIKYVLLAYENGQAVGCGAIKKYNERSMEVKRMFVPLEYRGRGIASIILAALEQWTSELGYQACILETGIKQHEAIGLYQKCGYLRIPNYGQYEGVNNSLCFEKIVGG